MKKKILLLLPVTAMLMLPLVYAHPAKAYGRNQTRYKLSQAKNKNIQHQLRQLLQEHAVAGGWAFIARYDQSPQEEQFKQMVEANTQKLTDLAGDIYGQEMKNEFKEMWNKHIELLVQYTDAVKANDSGKKQEITQQLNTSADQMTEFFYNNSGNRGRSRVSREQLKGTIGTHIDLEKGVIDAHAQGDKSKVQELLNQACYHAIVLADEIFIESPVMAYRKDRNK